MNWQQVEYLYSIATARSHESHNNERELHGRDEATLSMSAAVVIPLSMVMESLRDPT